MVIHYHDGTYGTCCMVLRIIVIEHMILGPCIITMEYITCYHDEVYGSCYLGLCIITMEHMVLVLWGRAFSWLNTWFYLYLTFIIRMEYIILAVLGHALSSLIFWLLFSGANKYHIVTCGFCFFYHDEIYDPCCMGTCIIMMKNMVFVL